MFIPLLRTRTLRRTTVGAIFLLTVLAFVLTSRVARAQADPQISISSVRIGWYGVFKVGRWSPIQFEIQAPPGTAVTPVIKTADPDGLGTLQPLPEITVPDSGTAQVSGRFRSGRVQAPIQILLQSEGQTLARETVFVDGTAARALRQDVHLWLTLGKQPLFESLASRWNTTRSEAIRLVELEANNPELTAAITLDGVDVVILDASSVVDEVGSKALEGWVQRGGKLIISGGENAVAIQSGTLANWLPALPTGTMELRNLDGINELVGGQRLHVLGSVQAATLDARQGRALARGLSGPLVLRTAYGTGTVTFVAVALDEEPVTTWDEMARTDFAAILADATPPWKRETASAQQSSSAANLNPLGVNDLQTQLNHALDHTDKIRRPSHWAVIGWVALFAVIIGPLDYLLTHRLLKRPSWTWGTLPLWIALVLMWAVTQADSTNDHRVAPRSFELVELDAAQGTIRSRSWFRLYALRNERRRITAKIARNVSAEPLTGPVRIGWTLRPEDGFRGMYRSGGIDESQPQYRFSPAEQAIENLPMRIWSTRILSAEWEAAVDPQSLAQSQLLDNGAGRLSGTFHFNLPFQITDWFIAYSDFSYTPRLNDDGKTPVLTAGTDWDIRELRSGLFRSRLTGLTGTTIMQEGGKRTDVLMERRSYNPFNDDLGTIARMISFHETAGGMAYTGLANQSLERADLSHLLRLRRAIVFGKLQQPLTEYSVDEATAKAEQQDVFVRLILPVEVMQRSPDAAPTPDLLNIAPDER